MSLKSVWFSHNVGVIKPSLVPNEANRPANKGATALVPPTTSDDPCTKISYPELGSASPATSGTIRPVPAVVPVGGAGAPICQLCVGKIVEYPPPVPSPSVCPGLSFHTVSCVVVFNVPPQPTTCGHDEGASTLAGVDPPSLESLSPDAAKTAMPNGVAVDAADSICCAAGAPQTASSAPQLMEHTSHPSCAAFCTALAMSCDQYMRMVAGLPVAAKYAAPATSMSSATSISASFDEPTLWLGLLIVPSTETSVICGLG